MAAPVQLQPYAFTSANAAQAAHRMHELQRLRSVEPKPQAQDALCAQNGNGGPHARKIERLESQLEQLDELLDKAKTSADWRDLTNARTRLFEQWRVLSGIPVPGSRRPGREPGPKRPAAWAQPIAEDQPGTVPPAV